jgi:hypothetical protein
MLFHATKGFAGRGCRGILLRNRENAFQAGRQGKQGMKWNHKRFFSNTKTSSIFTARRGARLACVDSPGERGCTRALGIGGLRGAGIAGFARTGHVGLASPGQTMGLMETRTRGSCFRDSIGVDGRVMARHELWLGLDGHARPARPNPFFISLGSCFLHPSSKTLCRSSMRRESGRSRRRAQCAPATSMPWGT